MRIPSQFNDESLYRGKKRPASGASHSYRRLLRLVVALVLVVLVMREAARPQLYEAFFGDPVPAMLTTQPPRTRGVYPGPQQSVFPPQPTLDTEEASDFQQNELGRTAANEVQAMSWDERRGEWIRLDRLESRSPPEQTRLDALAEAAMQRVVDGSVWRSEDFDAFYFQLAKVDTLEIASSVHVSVLPLLQQPEVYRGQNVWFRGRVVRSERLPASENDFGVKHFWQLWIIPDDGGERPLVAVVPDNESAEAHRVASETLDQSPRVQIVGRFFKRLAYRSSIGADLAPVVVGRIDTPRSGTPAVKPAESGTQVSSSQLWGGIALACAVGLAIAMVTMWRTSVSARRARALRQANAARSAEFLRDLGQSRDLGERHD